MCLWIYVKQTLNYIKKYKKKSFFLYNLGLIFKCDTKGITYLEWLLYSQTSVAFSNKVIINKRFNVFNMFLRWKSAAPFHHHILFYRGMFRSRPHRTCFWFVKDWIKQTKKSYLWTYQNNYTVFQKNKLLCIV
jgi:hypothetical protein